MKEQYKIIEGINDYQASNLGNIKSFVGKKERILKPTLSGSGYPRVNLWINKKRKGFDVHMLVAMAFFGHKPNGFKITVDHIDNDKTNNRLDNLQLLTHRENAIKRSKEKKSSSIYTGVYYAPVKTGVKKWRASIKVNGETISLGMFIHPYWAHLAYEQELRNTL